MSETANRTVNMELSHVEQYFPQGSGSFHALGDINLQIRSEDFICLLGSSGCGKTSLLNILAGYAKPTSGTVEVGGKTFLKPNPDVGVVFQQANLFPWMSVRDNIEFGLKRKGGFSRAERRERAEYYMDVVGLSKFADSLPHQLSGGMKQRATIARTLAPDPKIVLLDEPFSALDALTREHLQQHIYSIWQKTKKEKSFLFITHDVDEALILSNRILVMQPNPGHITNDLENKLDKSNAGFIRSIRETNEFWTMRDYLIDQITTKEGRSNTDIPVKSLKKVYTH
jgi:ABC-type nitrate/sulfonate/bicarbonate transport system ATPase subunit